MISYDKRDPKGINVSEMVSQKHEMRRVYFQPRLEVMGNIRDLTLGGSPGAADSGLPNTDPLGLNVPELPDVGADPGSG